MNLKEAFRYQNFLDKLMYSAVNSLCQKDHCLSTKKLHLRSKADATLEDYEEVIMPHDFIRNDDMIKFMAWLVSERTTLTQAINEAKLSIDFDMDAAIQTNKYRQRVYTAINSMLGNMPSEAVDRGKDFKFNIEGNQMPYYYDIKVTTEDAYDRRNAKSVMRAMITEADTTSEKIDSAMINTKVEYEPRFNVNESFEDVLENFLEG